MSQRDGFASGFLAGAIFGGVVGGLVGALVAYRRDPELAAEEEPQMTVNPIDAKKASTSRRRQMQASDAEGIEVARRSLEDKIAQLNATIDEVRQQLGSVNGSPSQPPHERSLTKDS